MPRMNMQCSYKKVIYMHKCRNYIIFNLTTKKKRAVTFILHKTQWIIFGCHKPSMTNLVGKHLSNTQWSQTLLKIVLPFLVQ